MISTHSHQCANAYRSIRIGVRLCNLVVLSIVLALIGVGRGAGPGPDTLKKIADAYLAKRQSMKTFFVEYDVRAKALVGMDVLRKQLGIRRLANYEESVGIKGDLRYTHVLEKGEVDPGGNPPERTVIYDGKVLKETRRRSLKSSEELVMVLAVRKEDSLYFPTTYTGAVGLEPSDPGEKVPGSVTSRNNIPGMFKRSKFVAAPNLEPVNGAPCIVVESPGRQKLWLDPEMGYAVRQRELYKNGSHTSTVKCRDFTRAAPGLWLPRSVTWLTVAPKSSPSEYQGKFLQAKVLRVRRLEVNQPEHNALFALKVPPGTQVLDETLASDDPTKIPNEPNRTSPTVAYVQPANGADLETVIAKAKKIAEAENREPLWGSRFYTVSVVLLVAAVSAWFGHRLYLRRRAGDGPS